MEPWWEFILEHEVQLRRLCARQALGRQDLVDDMYCDVVVGRCKAVYMCYNPSHESGASLKHFMLLNLRLYMSKWIATKGRARAARFDVQLPKDFDVGDNGHESCADFDAKELVKKIMGELSYEQRALVRLYYWEGYTFKDIAEHMGFLTEGAWKARHRVILERAMQVAKDIL